MCKSYVIHVQFVCMDRVQVKYKSFEVVYKSCVSLVLVNCKLFEVLCKTFGAGHMQVVKKLFKSCLNYMVHKL